MEINTGEEGKRRNKCRDMELNFWKVVFAKIEETNEGISLS
jgi:hypothetical protein